ncbi:MAG: ORF6N domain-containing protein [Actinomycetes bacterium]|jgi:hypothetical protein|nr:ORF6N domain-containing protein [Actinomycetes bacterium]
MASIGDVETKGLSVADVGEPENIKELIRIIRGKQVLLDSDVARLYGYEVRRINETAQRNNKRFPPEFRFRLTGDEYDALLRSQIVTPGNDQTDEIVLRSQNATLKSGRGHHRKYLPYAYTEQGIGMLSGLLKNEIAVHVSVGIMNAFVEMRQFISTNHDVFANIAHINNRLLDHDQRLVEQGTKIDEILALLGTPETEKQFIFYKGQFYDALKLVIRLLRQAKTSIVVVDNYVDNSLLEMLENKREGVSVTVVTAKTSGLSDLHLLKFGAQYGPVAVVVNKDFHDRFIILDNKEVYVFGSSLKDAGNKCFGVWKMEDSVQLRATVMGIIASAK